MELIGMFIAAVFSILVLLYALGDSVFFRVAANIFIGVAAGYAAAVAINNVIIPQLMSMSLQQMAVPLLFIGLLLTKLSPRTAFLGNPASAFLIGVGAAIAVAGAIQGTLLPQTMAAAGFFNSGLVQGSFILLGTLTSLLSFHFTTRSSPNQIPKRNRLMEMISSIGRVFISVTFGVVFAGVYSAALTALVERIGFLSNTLEQLLRLAGVQ